MATTPFRFLQRRTSTSGRVPDVESLLSGELYVQLADETIYFRNDKCELVSVITDGDAFSLDKIKFTGASSGDFAVWNGSKFVPYSTGNLVADLETGALASVFAAINHSHAQYVLTGQTGNFITTSQTGDLSSVFAPTGDYVTATQTGTLTSVFAPTGDYIVASTTGSFVTTSQTGSFITASMTGAFGGASGVDLTSYVTTGSTGNFITTSQTGDLSSVFAPTGDYVTATQTGTLTSVFAPTGDYVFVDQTGSFVTTSQTGTFASIDGGYLLSSQIPTITGDICILAGTNNALICQLQGYPVSNATPVNGQTLQFNGTSWVPGDIAAGGNGGGGLVYYFNETVAADLPTGNLPASLSGTYELGRSGMTGQFTVTKTNLETTGYTSMVGFVTDILDPEVTSIPAGLFDFNIWASSNTTTQTVLKLNVYSYNGSTAPTLLASSDDVYTYDGLVTSQYTMSVVLPQTTILSSDRLYIEILAKALGNNKDLTLHFGGNTPSHVHTTVPSVGGSGLVKVINGIMQSRASLITDSDISESAAIDASKIQSGVFALCSETGRFETTGYARNCFVNTGQTGIYETTGYARNCYVTTGQTGTFGGGGTTLPNGTSANSASCWNGSIWTTGQSYVATGQTGNFVSTGLGYFDIRSITESIIVCSTGSTGLIHFDILSGSSIYNICNSTAKSYLNLRGNASCSLNSLIPVNRTLAISFLNTNGATAYELTGISIDGTGQTIRWMNGTGGAPSGNASAIDMYSIVTVKTGNGLYNVFGSTSFLK
jgi:hypothetical protein